MAARILGNYSGYTGSFLTDLSAVYSDRIFKLSIKDNLGIDTIEYKYKAILLTAYYEILLDYFSPADNDDTNFFDDDEIFDILQHFNNIAGSYINYEF